MKKTGLNWWCDRAWIKFGCALTGIVMIAMMLNWERWSTELKIIAGVAALIPVHVIEEWVFPGGFHYHYNVLMKSKQPNHTPMCRLSDMITNLFTTILYILFTVYCLLIGRVPKGFVMATMLFGCLEVFAHTMFGLVMYLKFKSRGKTTIYGPGSVTAYLGFGVLAILSFYCLRGETFTAGDYALCFGILFLILVGFILLPENVIRQKKDHPYDFASAGYYERFL